MPQLKIILAGLIPNLCRAHRICFLSQLFLPVKKDNRAACGNLLRKSKTDRVKRDDDGMRDKEAKYREPCQDARGLNTTAILISLYTFQSQKSFLNLLMFLLLSQPFHHCHGHLHWFCLNPELLMFVLNSCLIFELFVIQRWGRGVAAIHFLNWFWKNLFQIWPSIISRICFIHLLFTHATHSLPKDFKCPSADRTGEISASHVNC